MEACDDMTDGEFVVLRCCLKDETVRNSVKPLLSQVYNREIVNGTLLTN